MKIIVGIREHVLDFLDERFGFREVLEKNLTKKLVPKKLTWFGCFGGLALVMFILQVGTGVFLMMYYRSTPDEAFSSVQMIKEEVPYGWLIQRLHSVGSNVMIILVMLHMLRVLYKGIYKSPRELHWVSGMILLFMTTVMGFTGYALPWTQLSYWAATVGTEMPGAIPFIGEMLVHFTRGGPQLSGVTLTRFYALHVVGIPAIMLMFMGAHFVMIRRTGICTPL